MQKVSAIIPITVGSSAGWPCKSQIWPDHRAESGPKDLVWFEGLGCNWLVRFQCCVNITAVKLCAKTRSCVENWGGPRKIVAPTASPRWTASVSMPALPGLQGGSSYDLLIALLLRWWQWLACCSYYESMLRPAWHCLEIHLTTILHVLAL